MKTVATPDRRRKRPPPAIPSPDSQVTLHAQLHVPLERGGVHRAPHHLEHFLCQFDVRLPAQVPTRRVPKHEPKVCNIIIIIHHCNHHPRGLVSSQTRTLSLKHLHLYIISHHHHHHPRSGELSNMNPKSATSLAVSIISRHCSQHPRCLVSSQT